MKITLWKLVAQYEDGSERDVSFSIPMRLTADIERFLDALEAEDEEDNISIDCSKCVAKAGDEDSFSNLGV
jgi:hypothetical protein